MWNSPIDYCWVFDIGIAIDAEVLLWHRLPPVVRKDHLLVVVDIAMMEKCSLDIAPLTAVGLLRE